MFKLAQSVAFLAVSSIFATLSVAGEIRDMTADDKPEDLITPYEFSVISFYKSSDADSVEVDSFMAGAKALLENKIKVGSWSPRNIGWFRVDIDKYPDLALDKSGKPDQMVVGPGLRRMIHFVKLYAKREENE